MLQNCIHIPSFLFSLALYMQSTESTVFLIIKGYYLVIIHSCCLLHLPKQKDVDFPTCLIKVSFHIGGFIIFITNHSLIKNNLDFIYSQSLLDQDIKGGFFFLTAKDYCNLIYIYIYIKYIFVHIGRAVYFIKKFNITWYHLI